ncbi:MAG: FAD-binding and (Fe-S)-binding domain-containing protein [Magnetovibrionaceae bacterium]
MDTHNDANAEAGSETGVDYGALGLKLADLLGDARVIRDPLRLFTYSTDASFYRLTPKIVVQVLSDAEVQGVIELCREAGAPMTFRAAGTSLSGQAVTDSVLVMLADGPLGAGWRKIDIDHQAGTVSLGPGVIGAEANAALAPFAKKIGPDPASIGAAKIGGIAANNASGMCCGTAQNSYQTVAGLKLILADGTILETANEQSRANFRQSHALLLQEISDLAREVSLDTELAETIRRKFKIKNTTGYSLNALVDFEDPIDILEHLMIGSEGTLAFMAEITYRTVPEYADKAAAMLYFEDVEKAANCTIALKSAPVDAAEIMDRRSLQSVEGKPGMPSFLGELGPDAAALLVETRGKDAATLDERLAAIDAVLKDHPTVKPVEFTKDAHEIAALWKVRKGLFPSLGSLRAAGTTVLIEDIAFPIEHLAAGTLQLQALFKKHGYEDGIILGHAFEGNLHFSWAQRFDDQAEVDRYDAFMDDVCKMVVDTFDGSLKAEHGTGRNMAPYVEMEWGPKAYELMKRLKTAMDPRGLLNPGVILNDDPKIHVKNLKAMAPAHGSVDTCIECGFCEPVCPSAQMTLTPRQRIAGFREITRLRNQGDQATADRLFGDYAYKGVDTCAACGLCATACPMGIETGILTKFLRGERRGPVAEAVGKFAAKHYGKAMGVTRLGLDIAGTAQRVLGDKGTDAFGRTLRKLTGGSVPLWTSSMPQGAPIHPGTQSDPTDSRPAVVYLPSCASRTMGPAVGDPETDSLPECVESLLNKAGYRVVYPKGLSNLCCGQPFDSKGLKQTADDKASETEAALMAASDGGKLPILCDTSPCSYRLKQHLADRLVLQDITEFLHDHALENLDIEKQSAPIAVHNTCSTRKMGLEPKLVALAQACAEEVIVPADVGCCGFAGDKGFTTPELNAHALRRLSGSLPEACTEGVSTSRTCEIGASHHGGRPYHSIAYLLNRVAKPKNEA